ncbi:MAG: 16S rRNA (cytosine(1402)-N(4))-methyltransferase RsmH [Actinobacteria bacterium]|nr:16S rRNA (cytosine(1402)-N(4))-methyltransferase RsmH [Actinomycetota bacterium]
MAFDHVPVLLREVVDWLSPGLEKTPVLIDCTVGGGGHSAALLERNPGISVLGLDRDPQALAAASAKLESSRVRLVQKNFRQLSDVMEEYGYEEAGAVLYDLGVSSPQLDRADRGFGYRGNAALDMRMDPEAPTTAAIIVNTYSEQSISSLIARYGEERFARRIARAIVRRRAKEPFATADDLAEVVRDAIPAATRRTGPHPARRTFQALRIEVNDELEALTESLPAAVEATAPGGRVAVISYHSLEDRIAKRTFAELSRGCTCPSDFPICVCGRESDLRVLTKKPVRPTDEESASNPRSDSAKMRVAEKLGRPAA